MEEIKVIPKPEWVSWEDIHQLLLKANKVNEKNGFSMVGLTCPPEELEKQLEDGLCVVAMHGDKLVGVSACSFNCVQRWYNKKEKSARKFFSGILKSYQGCGILDEIDKVLDNYIKKSGFSFFVASSADQNITVLKESFWGGYKVLTYISFPETNYYSVIFGKWLNKCPFSDRYIKFRFWLSKIYTKTRYKVGRVERFTFLHRIWKMIKKLLRH